MLNLQDKLLWSNNFMRLLHIITRRYMTYNNKRRDDQVKEIIFMDDEKESHKELTENQRLKRLF